MAKAPAGASAEDQVLEELRLLDVLDRARDDPKYLINEMRGWDPTLQEAFGFDMFDPSAPWYWQRYIVDWIMGTLSDEDAEEFARICGWEDEKPDPAAARKFLILKARQLGITWVVVALGLWFILMRPGSNVVCYSHGLEEAKQLISRAWLMYQSLPPVLRRHVDVITPARAHEPSDKIVIRFPDGRVSRFFALPDTEKAGHSYTITLCLMDEVAYMDYARRIYTAANPAVSRGGILVVVSTAYGVSNEETGEGSFFHHLWVTRHAKRLATRFLPWHLHPERGGMGIEGPGRDPEWYEREAMALSHTERNQQYPLNPDNAFILSGDLYFDQEALAWYRGETRRAQLRGQFLLSGGEGRFLSSPQGPLQIYSRPRPGGVYGISADVASGKSADYSSAHVLDLMSGEIVATLRAKIDIPTFGFQLKLLGRWYAGPDGSPAEIIPERAGGWGEALIAYLRSSQDGLGPYPRIYRYVRKSNIERPLSDDYGFPMTAATRGQVLDQLSSFLRNRKLPFLTDGDVDELGTFVYREKGTSPRAMDGCNDDRVISLALIVHLMLEKGQTSDRALREQKQRKRTTQKYIPPPIKP